VTGQRFTTTVTAHERGRVLIPVPFDPDTVWGSKPRHHVGGAVNRIRVRGVVERVGDGYGFTLGPAWLRDCGVTVGETVTVDIEPEGPQRADLAADVAAALDAHPQAAAFFDSLRIAEMIHLLETGHKQRPQP
jgi:hypothetical protein